MKRDLAISMKSLSVILCVLINAGCKKQASRIDESLQSATTWFKAWELISNDVFKLKEKVFVRYVFFDSAFVYTTSPLTGAGGDTVTGPQLYDERQTWYKKPHHGKILMPDSTQVPVKIMSYASQLTETGYKGFFVMPLLSFWEREKVADHGIGLDKLTTGVFLHEFCHTRQMESFDSFGKHFDAYLNRYGGENFGDDMMQNFYEHDARIKSMYEKELVAFSHASVSAPVSRNTIAKDALQSFALKHKMIEQQDGKDLRTIDDIWLTMEGAGQYAMYAYFIHPRGANLSRDNALKAMKTSSWSQEEGFALFSLLSQYEAPQVWARHFFGSNMSTIVAYLQSMLAEAR